MTEKRVAGYVLFTVGGIITALAGVPILMSVIFAGIYGFAGALVTSD